MTSLLVLVRSINEGMAFLLKLLRIGRISSKIGIEDEEEDMLSSNLRSVRDGSISLEVLSDS